MIIIFISFIYKIKKEAKNRVFLIIKNIKNYLQQATKNKINKNNRNYYLCIKKLKIIFLIIYFIIY